MRTSLNNNQVEKVDKSGRYITNLIKYWNLYSVQKSVHVFPTHLHFRELPTKVLEKRQ